MLVAPGVEIEAIDSEGALFDERAIDLLGAYEFELSLVRRGGVDGRQETEAASAVAGQGNDAQLDGEELSLLGGMGPEGARRRLRIAGNRPVEGGAIAAGVQVGEGHGVEFAAGVSVTDGGRIVGGENAQRAVVVQEHRHGIGAEENVAEFGMEVISRHIRTSLTYLQEGTEDYEES